MELPNKIESGVEISEYFGRYIGNPVEIETQKWDKLAFYQNRYLQRKGWVFVSYIIEEFICSIAIVDAGYLGNAFIYLFDRQEGILHEEKIIVPFAFPLNFKPSLNAQWKLKSFSQIWELRSDKNSIQLSYSGKKIKGEIDLKISQPGLNVISHSIGRPFHYTYKNMGLESNISIKVNNKTYQSFGNNANIDFSFGYPPRTTTWNWASLIGSTEDGIPVCINLVAEFNNGLENVLWFGKDIQFLSQSIFKYSNSINQNKVQIETADETLKINFYCEGARKETIDVGFLKSDFVQPFGRFDGVYLHKGEATNIKGYGLLEEHTAIW